MKLIRRLVKGIRKYRQKDLILVYQMGKVGSMSIRKSLERLGINVLHKHTFYGNLVSTLFWKYESRKLLNKNILKNIKVDLYNYIVLKSLRSNDDKLKIITMVREPISRNISMYFQDFQIPLLQKYITNSRTISSQNNLEVYINDFFENFNHSHGVNWFQNEFDKAFGVDVFNYEFDKQLGYRIIETTNLDIMIIKMEKMDVLENEIGSFINRSDFILVNENVSDSKWYSSVYKEFKNKIKFDSNYVEEMYNSKYSKHFYTDEEIKIFRNRLKYSQEK